MMAHFHNLVIGLEIKISNVGIGIHRAFSSNLVLHVVMLLQIMWRQLLAFIADWFA